MQWTEEELYLIADLAHAIALEGRYVEAVTLFEGLVSVAPAGTNANAYARQALAALHLRLGDPAEALAALGSATDTAGARLRLECALGLGRRHDAQREFQAIAGRLEPGQRKRYALLLESKQLPGAALDN